MINLRDFHRFWIQQIIRQKLGFDGVLFSDDLSMKAAHVAGDAGERIKSALTAGCDMGLVCNDRDSALIALEKLQKNPELCNEKNSQRLANMKADFHAWQNDLSQTANLHENWQALQQKINQQFFFLKG